MGLHVGLLGISVVMSVSSHYYLPVFVLMFSSCEFSIYHVCVVLCTAWAAKFFQCVTRLHVIYLRPARYSETRQHQMLSGSDAVVIVANPVSSHFAPLAPWSGEGSGVGQGPSTLCRVCLRSILIGFVQSGLPYIHTKPEKGKPSGLVL